MNYVKSCLIITMLLGVGYSQCNESNWQEYYPDMVGCDLAGANLGGEYLAYANLSYANLEGANLEGANLEDAILWEANLTEAYLEAACLEGAINSTQTDYFGTPILEGCAGTFGDCSFEDTDADGYDDVSYDAGAESGDLNLDGRINIYDILKLVDLAAGAIEPELCIMESGDLNNDGIINYFDVWELTQLVMGF